MSARRAPQQHIKIAEHLRAKILSGEISAGSLLPSEAELCEEFDTSRGPVRQALASLRTEGIISSGRGRRSVVLEHEKTETFETFISTHDWIESNGWDPSSKTLWLARCPAPEHVAKMLAVEEDDPVVFLHRIRYANGIPVIIERSYFTLAVGKHVLYMDPDQGSLHAKLRDVGLGLDHGRREMCGSVASEEDAKLLEITPGDPTVESRILLSDHNGSPIEYTETLQLFKGLTISYNYIAGTPSPLNISMRHSDRLSQ